MKYNYMMDVAASIESDQPFEDIPLDELVAAFLKRLTSIIVERDYDAISEADCFEISSPNPQPPTPNPIKQ